MSWNNGSPLYSVERPVSSIQNKVFLKFGAAMLISAIGALLARATGIMIGGIATLVLFIAIMLANIIVARKAQTMNPMVAYVLLAVESLFLGFLAGGFTQGYSPMLAATALISTTLLFLVLGLAGWFTKKDLSGWGPMLIVALIVIIIVEVILMFIHVPVLVQIISAISILVFAAFTAYDMQRVRRMYDDGTRGAENASTLMALELFLDFINLFLNLLQVLGGFSRG